MRLTKKMSGFTLVELLVVIAIISILASVVVGSFGEARKRARDGQRIADMAQIQLALEQYYNACRQYPASLTPGASCGTVTLGMFMASIPPNPTGGNYTYTPSGGTDYCLSATLETEDPVLHTRNASGGSCTGCTVSAKKYCVRP